MEMPEEAMQGLSRQDKYLIGNAIAERKNRAALAGIDDQGHWRKLDAGERHREGANVRRMIVFAGFEGNLATFKPGDIYQWESSRP